MASVTMNIDSAVWASPGSVTLANEAILDIDSGGDIVEHASGTDTHISSSKVVNIRGVFTIGFNDRVAALTLLGKLDIEATMTIKIKDIDAATGIQLAISTARLQRVMTNAQFNAPTLYSAVFYARASNGTTNPISPSAY